MCNVNYNKNSGIFKKMFLSVQHSLLKAALFALAKFSGYVRICASKDNTKETGDFSPCLKQKC